MELVSIIIPAYNAETTIHQAIESLLKQTYSEIEIIVVNDGSVDNTHEICMLLKEKDSRIKYVSIVNGGVSNARNTGIRLAKGTYIAFVDSDDSIEEVMIERMVSSMSYGMDIVSCGYKVLNQKKQVLFSKNPQRDITNKNNMYRAVENLQNCQCFNILWNKLFKSDVIKKNHILMDTSISMGEDFLFVLDYLSYMNGGIQVITDSMYRYTLSSNGLQANFKGEVSLRISQLERLRKLYLSKDFPLPGFYLEELRTIYVLILENANSPDNIKNVLSTPACKDVCCSQINCTGKYKLFLILFKINNAKILIEATKAFKFFKELTGRSFKW